MKKKSREITVFSMSALDLFASAMGSFILLTVVFIPFFPNTGDSPIRVADVMEKLRSAEQELDTLVQEQAELKAQLAAAAAAQAAADAASAEAKKELDKMKNAPKVQFPPLDLVIALDTTSSMQDEVEGLRSEIAQLAELMMDMAPSVGIGVVDFKDRCEATPVRAFDLEVMNGGSLARLQSFANSMYAGSENCNRDGEEAVASALDRAISMNWRGLSDFKIIVVITDNPAYPERVAASLSAARSFHSRGAGFQVATVSASSGGVDYLRALADAGGGKFITGGGSFSVTLLLALAGT